MADTPIWVALSTDEVGDWIDSCPDYLTDGLYELVDDDVDEIPDELFEQAKQWVVSRLTDGRLSNELNVALYDTWLGEKFNDMVWDVLLDFIGEEVRSFVKHERMED